MNFEKLRQLNGHDIATAVTAGLTAILSFTDIIRYAVMGEPVSFVTMLIVNVLFVLCALSAFFGKLPPLFFAVTVSAAALFVITNNAETTLYNFTFALQAGVSAIGGITGTVLGCLHRVRPGRIGALFLAFAGLLAAVFGAVWGAETLAAKNRTHALPELWAVPTIYDRAECAQQGTIEKIEYKTKAYATDGREVTKSAYVYLPYGYSENERYDILYLLHGTGDDESYWLIDNPENKTMIDNLIFYGVIRPLLIVTPTFYVEGDCANDLDPLTYSFNEELRNDLMPAVEGKYSTYAERCDAAAFTESRSHRAFAGLSRGAVTTLHSAFCGSLDYFSSFGTFSASRTPVEEFRAAIQSEKFKDFSIDYRYLASGAFDFGLHSQVTDYKALLKVEPRLVRGVNTSMDVFPMRYHSMGNRHLALYNFLQKIF